MKSPPRLARWILTVANRQQNRTIILGDFEEFYHEIAQESGAVRAYCWYWGQALKSIPRFVQTTVYWRSVMLKNYLKMAVRNLFKQTFFSMVNIAGLAVGICCCLLILLYVQHEMSYDAYHTHANRIYRLALDLKWSGDEHHIAGVAAVTAEAVVNDYPEVEDAVRIYLEDRTRYRLSDGDQTFLESHIAYTDASFFHVFSIPLIAGDPKTALAEPNSLVMSEEMAYKYFGEDDPLGRTLTMDNTTDYKVTGVFKEIPSNTHFHFDFFGSLTSLEDSRAPWWLHNITFRTYLLLHENADPRELEKKLPEMVRKYVAPPLEQSFSKSWEEITQMGMGVRYFLQPLKSIHLHSDLQYELEPNGDIKYVIIFSSIAFFILLIACINFMNLSTARSTRRAREVGVRKAVGSLRWQLIFQFLAEALFLSFLALVLALILTSLALPYFNDLAQRDISLSQLLQGMFPLYLLGFVVAAGVVSGSYPAFFLSSYRPVDVFKGQSAPGAKSRWLRNGLVVFQFFVSTVLIIGTLVVSRQMHFVQNRKLGFEKDQVLVIHDTYVLGAQIESFKQALLQNPRISSATITGFLPVDSDRMMDVNNPEGIYREKGTPMETWPVDFDYVKTMGMEIVAGRDFSRAFSTDSSAIIVNEAAVRQFGWEHPIGKKIGDWRMMDDQRVLVDFPVIGVVKDFHYESLRNYIGPLRFFIGRSPDLLSLRMHAEDISQTINWIREQWAVFVPGEPFDFSFMDDRFDTMYRSEQRFGDIFAVFSVLAVSIGCLGLLGLAAFTAERKIKEIGIRKVLGASVSGIVILLSRTFIKWVLIANVAGWPVAYFIMRRWLQGFAYRTDMTPLTFILSGALTFGIAFLTVSYQAIRAARTNPVQSLKYE